MTSDRQKRYRCIKSSLLPLLQSMKSATMDDSEIDEAELTNLIATTNRLITGMVNWQNDKNMLRNNIEWLQDIQK